MTRLPCGQRQITHEHDTQTCFYAAVEFVFGSNDDFSSASSVAAVQRSVMHDFLRYINILTYLLTYRHCQLPMFNLLKNSWERSGLGRDKLPSQKIFLFIFNFKIVY